ncbi:hypothetical protein BDN71DRAFT_1154869 [Pleurotus eryngii]|uniref:Uncharacterized protein n=1 Tax=Pleurotus eryngii TaxID=5323 RepID=A0A9P5ZTU3_PLEER|nr:hypothetical protein BDN71DRAFT_1154869 [Pleurotus eryngii]
MVDINLARIRDTEAVVYAYSFFKVNQVSRTPVPLQRVAISQTSLDSISPSAGMAVIAGIEIESHSLWACLPKHNIIALRLDSADSSDNLPPPPRMIDIIISLSNSHTLDILRGPYDTFLPLLLIPGSLIPQLLGHWFWIAAAGSRATAHCVNLNDWLIQRQALRCRALERLSIVGCPHMKAPIEATLQSSVGVRDVVTTSTLSIKKVSDSIARLIHGRY